MQGHEVARAKAAAGRRISNFLVFVLVSAAGPLAVGAKLHFVVSCSGMMTSEPCCVVEGRVR